VKIRIFDENEDRAVSVTRYAWSFNISIKLHSNCNFKNFNSALDVAIEFSAFLSGNEREVLVKLSVGAEN